MSSRRRLVAAALVLAAALVSCRRYDPAALTTVLLPLPEEPRIGLRVLVRAGSANDPSGKAGLARLTWSLLAGGGTRSRAAEEIARAFYPLALSPALRLGRESVVFSATFPREDLERFYGIFRDMLLDPGFREDDFERIRTAQIEALDTATAGGDDLSLARDILAQLAFEDHPYGHPETGTSASAAGLTLDDVRAFYRDHFVRGNIVIGLAGGYPADFPKRLETDFNALPRGFTPRLVLPAARRPNGLEVVLAEKPATATTIGLGLPVDGAADDKDRAALAIAAAFLEGRPTRTLPGSPFPAAGGRPWLFAVELGPLPESGRPEAVREVLQRLAGLAGAGIPEETFARLRDTLLASYRFSGQSPAGRLDILMDARERGRRDSETETRDAPSRLTRDDVGAAVRKHLDPAGAFIAVVAPDAEALKAALAAALNIGPESVRTAPAPAFFRKPGWPDR